MMTVSDAYVKMTETDNADGGECERQWWKDYLTKYPEQKADVIGLYTDLAKEEEADLSSDEDDIFYRQAAEYYEIAEWISKNC